MTKLDLKCHVGRCLYIFHHSPVLEHNSIEKKSNSRGGLYHIIKDWPFIIDASDGFLMGSLNSTRNQYGEH